MKLVHDLDPSHVKIDEPSLDRMLALGKKLNLKIHGIQVCDDRRVQVPLAATIEVHETFDE